MAKRKAGLWRYLKEAFKFRWNLLAVGGAAVGAVLTGHGDILLPLVGAAELMYLAGLTSLPRFQAAIDAKAASERHPELAAGPKTPMAAQQKLASVLGGLNSAARSRFKQIHARCHEMRRIAKHVTGSASSGSDTAHELRTPVIDRLLWVFLRLLFSQQALQRFLHATDENGMVAHIAELEAKRKQAEQAKDDRILRSLTDSITTAGLRLTNYQKAESNAKFVAVELDRIEGKILGITEMAVSNQDPDFISSQVDVVAESMAQTEETIRELNHITGLSDEIEGTPSILETNLTEVLEA